MARLPEQLRWAAAILGSSGLLGSFGLLRLYRSIPAAPGRKRNVRVAITAAAAIAVVICFAGSAQIITALSQRS